MSPTIYFFEKEECISERAFPVETSLRKLKVLADAAFLMMTSPLLKGYGLNIPDKNWLKAIIKIDDDTVFEKDFWLDNPRWNRC